MSECLPAHDWGATEAWLSTFYPFQVEWLLEPGRRAICVKARQIGWSHTTAAIAVIWAAFFGETVTVISIGQLESSEVLDKCARHAGVLEELGSAMARPRKAPNSTEIHFPSGGRIIALPSTGGRSFTGHVILDEYAYQEQDEKVWDAAAAVTMLGFKLRVISTPNGVGNDFYNVWTSAPSFERHEIDIDKAISQGFPVDMEDCWALAKGDPRIFDQLFRCKFLDNEQQYIPDDFIKLATKEGSPPNGVEHYAGLDIGETRDRTVLSIIRKIGMQRALIHIESHNRTDDALLDQLATKAYGTLYNARRLCGDATGLGTFPAKRWEQKYTSRFEGIQFDSAIKEDLATRLYDTMANGDLWLPKKYTQNGLDEAALLRDDIAAIRRLVTKSGHVRYDAKHTRAGHADRAWSLMLGLHAAGGVEAHKGRSGGTRAIAAEGAGGF